MKLHALVVCSLPCGDAKVMDIRKGCQLLNNQEETTLHLESKDA